MIIDNKTLRILYCPADYIDKSYLSNIDSLSKLQDKYLANYWIFTHYKLEHFSETWEASNFIDSLLIDNWFNLRIIAELIGGHLTRTLTHANSTLFFSDKRLLSFASMPLKYNLSIKGNDIDRLSCGFAFLRNISLSFPNFLRDRLNLCFPKNIQTPTVNIFQSPQNINLLNMAVDYAKTFY